MMDEQRTNKIRTVRDLKVYRKALDNAIEKKADSFCHPSS
jgi:tRNA U38,U39,U40 pseudouridine synthase TruA